MDLSSIFAYIVKIVILLMNSHIEIPDEIDEKLKKNHNLLSRQIRKTQTFLILQQIFSLILISLKSGIFILSFIAPILLLVIILERFFYWNYLILLQYQPLLFLLLTIVLILVGILSGYLSLLLTRYYLKSSKERHEYERLKEEFNKETPFSEFEEGKEGKTITKWYQQF